MLIKNLQTKQRKHHTIGETFIMPCAIDIVRELFGEEKSMQLVKIQISNDTVKRCITSMSKDITV